jgi:hypothetical protein
MRNTLFLVFTFLLLSKATHARVLEDTLTHSYVEAGAMASTSGYSPLWFQSLQYGAVPYQGATGIVKGYHGKNYFVPTKAYQKAKKYDWKYGVEAVAFGGKENDIRIIQAFVAGRSKHWELWMGRKKELIGLGDSTLSSGFWTFSGNALPPVKIHFGTLDYLDLFKGWVGVQMQYSDGLQDNFGPVIGALLHQKSLYGRIGKRKSKFNFFGGLNHNVSWAGERKSVNGVQGEQFPSNFATYFYVVTALKDRSLMEIDPNSTSDDTGNQYGNHLGSADIAIQFQDKKLGRFMLYKQTPYETGRLASLTTANDGITGLSWKINKRLPINHLVFEYVYTANQGNYKSGITEFLGWRDPHLIEVETYYNNTHGPWAYYGKGLGNPLLPIDRESAYQFGEGFAFSKCATKAYYVGVGGTLAENLSYVFRGSISRYTWPRNHLFPRITNEEMEPQTAWSFQVNGAYKKSYTWSAQIGYNQGYRLQNALGLMVSVRKDLF